MSWYYGYCLVDASNGKLLGSAENPNHLKSIFDKSNVESANITYCKPDGETLLKVDRNTPCSVWNEFANKKFYN